MRWSRLFAVATAVALTSLAVPASAGAAPRAARSATYVCKGGTIPAGEYRSIAVKGLCFGPAKGLVLVGGNVVVAPGATLGANYPSPGKGQPEGDATWRIAGNVIVQKGGTLALGCSPHFNCKITTHDAVGGSIGGFAPLGILVHSTSIGGNVMVSGGGGGVSCTPTGVFKLLGQPDYTDFEDNAVQGFVAISDMQSCWLGLARDAVHGSVAIRNDKMADPDAIEILSNAVAGSLACTGTTGVWDSAQAAFGQTTLYPRTAEPNAVVGQRFGQCVLASPATQGGTPGPGAF